MSGSTAMPTRCWRRPGRSRFDRFHFLKINHEGVKSPRQFSRTELVSDRRGSADVVPFRSSFRVPPAPSLRTTAGAAPRVRRRIMRCAHLGAGAGRLHDRPCRQAGPLRTGGVLDRGRHRHGARHVVGGDRDLFRVPRRRPDPADRPSGRDAIRLRGPHRRTARQGRSHHQPPVARPGAVRPEARPDHAPPDRAGIARHRARRHSRRHGHRIDPAAGTRRHRGSGAARARQNPRRSATP